MPVADSAEQSVVPPVYTVLFNSGAGQCELTDADKAYFSVVKQFVSANPESRIEITGYADYTGSETLNLKISTLRAEYVSQKLIDAGIPVALMATSGKGESEPVADNGTIEGRAKNRRVEIVTHKN